MASYTIVLSELTAYRLLYGKYGKGGSTNQSPDDITDAANEIILLAERIKADRAVVAMQKPEP